MEQVHVAWPVFLAATSCSIALLAWCGIALTRLLALRLNVLDVPNARSTHTTPIPIGGGIVLVIINLAAWIAFAVIHKGVTEHHTAIFIIGAMLVAGIGLIDDLRHVPYRIRFLVQGIAALVFILGYGPFNVVTFPVVGAVPLGVLGGAVTLVWFIGLTNAYNFMDGIDGMVGGQTIAAGFGWLVLGILTHHPLLEGLGICLAASSAGFLGHNWHPARIFMGDVGSTFLGYTFAAMTVVAAHSDPKLALAGILLVWPSIFDTGFTVFRRIARRENIFVGHRTFLFHRLINAGWSHAAASSLYIPLPVMGALLAATWEKASRSLHEAVAVVLISACFSLWFLVRHEEIKREPAHDAIAKALLEGAQAAELARVEPEMVHLDA